LDGVAVKMADVPAHIGLDDTPIDTLTGSKGFTWTLNIVGLGAIQPKVSV
jgi:hypothetical protein